MSDRNDDAVLQALLGRLLRFRLPRALELKKRVDEGQCLTDADIRFLKLAPEGARNGKRFFARNPQFHALGAQIVQLYDDIVSRAMKNETGNGHR